MLDLRSWNSKDNRYFPLFWGLILCCFGGTFCIIGAHSVLFWGLVLYYWGAFCAVLVAYFVLILVIILCCFGGLSCTIFGAYLVLFGGLSRYVYSFGLCLLLCYGFGDYIMLI